MNKAKTIAKRIAYLKTISDSGGDEQCIICLGIDIPTIDRCRRCLNDSPLFTQFAQQLTGENK
jgi:hypothetical protein